MVGSPDDCNDVGRLNAAASGSVKRNLASEITSSLDYGLDKQPIQSAHGHQNPQATKPGVVNEVPKASCDSLEDAIPGNSFSGFEHGAKNSELKQFVADCVSIYCGYFTVFI